MKRPPGGHRARRAFTIVELLISASAMGLVGGAIYYVLNTGMILFAKNTAVNMSHQQARVAVLKMEQSLHDAVSIPQLVDATGAVISGNGPAAGISFLVFASGPFQVASTAAAGQKQMIINFNGYAPKIGQRVCLPLHQLEEDITAISGSGNTRTVTLKNNLTRPVETSLDDAGVMTPVNVTCFLADRYTYLVNNGDLKLIRTGESNDKFLANDITSATPFSIPSTPLGAPYNRFVAAINLSTSDRNSSNRGFRSANMFLNAMVPYRAKLCFYQ